MSAMELNEAEIQLLATLRRAELEAQSTDRASLEAEGGRYWIFLEDWSDAYASQIAKGLVLLRVTGRRTHVLEAGPGDDVARGGTIDEHGDEDRHTQNHDEYRAGP